MDLGYRKFLGNYTSLSERYAEAFYGIIMVTGCTGMVTLAVPKNEAGIGIMVFTALMVNILWGLIDGFTVIYGGLVDNVAEDKAVREWREGTSDATEVLDGLDDSLVTVLDDEDKAKIAEAIRESKEYEPFKPKLDREGVMRILAIFSIDFVTVFPVIIPYFFIQDPTTAARWSFIIAIFLMFYLGYMWAKQARMNRYVVAVEFSIFTVGLLLISYALGGI